MVHTPHDPTFMSAAWTPDGAEDEAGAAVQTLACPGEEIRVIPPQARICDADCQKPVSQSPLGTCRGLCKKDGDAYGTHAGDHVCNTCGYSWS